MNNQSTIQEWLSLYERCTPAERKEITIALLKRIENRRTEAIEVYKKDASLLAGLSVAELRNVARDSAEDAYQWMLATFPESDEMLSAFECLSSFGADTKEPISHNDLTDVIASLKVVWAHDAADGQQEKQLRFKVLHGKASEIDRKIIKELNDDKS